MIRLVCLHHNMITYNALVTGITIIRTLNIIMFNTTCINDHIVVTIAVALQTTVTRCLDTTSNSSHKIISLVVSHSSNTWDTKQLQWYQPFNSHQSMEYVTTYNKLDTTYANVYHVNTQCNISCNFWQTLTHWYAFVPLPISSSKCALPCLLPMKKTHTTFTIHIVIIVAKCYSSVIS